MPPRSRLRFLFRILAAIVPRGHAPGCRIAATSLSLTVTVYHGAMPWAVRFGGHSHHTIIPRSGPAFLSADHLQGAGGPSCATIHAAQSIACSGVSRCSPRNAHALSSSKGATTCRTSSPHSTASVGVMQR